MGHLRVCQACPERHRRVSQVAMGRAWQTGNGRLACLATAEKGHWESFEQQDQQGPTVSQHRCGLALLQ